MLYNSLNVRGSIAADMRQYSPHWFDKSTVALLTAPESPKLDPSRFTALCIGTVCLKKEWGTISNAFSQGSRVWTASTEIQLILSLIKGKKALVNVITITALPIALGTPFDWLLLP